MTLNTFKRFIADEIPSILSFAGIAGFVTATIMAVKATPEANDILEENNPFIPNSGYEQYLEIAKLLLPIYGPAIGVMLISSGFIFASNNVSKRRLFAVNSLYMASQHYLDKLQDKIVEEVGERKFKKIENAATEPDRDPDIVPGEGMVLCYDTFSDRYFTTTSVETIRKGINDLNSEMFGEMFVTVNDFYAIVGLPPVAYSNDIGWVMEDGPIDIYIGSALTKDQVPCVTIKFNAVPKHIYHRISR